MLRDYVYIIIIGNQGSWRACVRARARARALARLCASVREFVRARARVRAHVSARGELGRLQRRSRLGAVLPSHVRVSESCELPSHIRIFRVVRISESCAFPSLISSFIYNIEIIVLYIYL